MRSLRRYFHRIATCAVTLATATAVHGAIIINEFQYDDSGTDDREFVELYNNARHRYFRWCWPPAIPPRPTPTSRPPAGFPPRRCLLPAIGVVGHPGVEAPNLVVLPSQRRRWKTTTKHSEPATRAA
jgi:hypothetical protein